MGRSSWCYRWRTQDARIESLSDWHSDILPSLLARSPKRCTSGCASRSRMHHGYVLVEPFGNVAWTVAMMNSTSGLWTFPPTTTRRSAKATDLPGLRLTSRPSENPSFLERSRPRNPSRFIKSKSQGCTICTKQITAQKTCFGELLIKQKKACLAFHDRQNIFQDFCTSGNLFRPETVLQQENYMT